MIANDCGVIPEMIPSKWSFDHFGECPSNIEHRFGFFDILKSV